jgi:O-acetyl-ADP-ribose deacetylase (regulator of RNase III)
MTKLSVIQGNITKLAVDAIVNAANTSLLGGGGVDGAIHKAAGPELLAECQTLNGCKTGEAKLTKGYNLPAKYVIHTVGPVWNGGKHHEEELLKNAYHNSLQLAKEYHIRTIAFPNISTGVYRFPKEQAAVIAVTTAKSFVSSNNNSLDEIIFVCFDNENYELYKRLVS